MNELKEFKAFFKQHGVVYEEWQRIATPKMGEDTVITVAQCHFLFKETKYVGCESDEMGTLYPRK